MSTGAILLADIIPSFIIKSLSPFLPYNANLRVFISCLLSITSFLSVAFATSSWIVVVGVILTSFASGLGEPTFLAHSTHYNKNVVSTWSSGTGGAGIIGALSYSLMREIGLSSRQTLLLMIFVPVLELLTFFLLLNKPIIRNHPEVMHEQRPLMASSIVQASTDPPLETIAQKFAYIPKLMMYFIPLSLVYFFEYFINQGLVRS
jgi:battenin